MIHVHDDGTADDDPNCPALPAMTEDRAPTPVVEPVDTLAAAIDKVMPALIDLDPDWQSRWSTASLLLHDLAIRGYRLTSVQPAPPLDVERLMAAYVAHGEAHPRENDEEPGNCECGQDMDAHAGGFALLYHDEYLIRALAARLGSAPSRSEPDPLRPEHPYNGGTCCDQPMADHASADIEWVQSQEWDGPVSAPSRSEPE